MTPSLRKYIGLEWPLTTKVPLLVAMLMVIVSVTASALVLNRLAQDQETQLRLLTGAYLDGLSSAVLPSVGLKDVWETFDSLDRARHRYAGVKADYVIVSLPDDTVLAASDPGKYPVNTRLPAAILQQTRGLEGLSLDSTARKGWVARSLRDGEVLLGRILVQIDISELLGVRNRTLLTLVLVNGALTILFTVLGYVLVKRMVKPLDLLSRYVEAARDGTVELIPESLVYRHGQEFGRLFDQYNAMARALNERESLAAKLQEEERYALLGRLASGMAHEVNNPLGGMLNAIDTLHWYGEKRAIREKSVQFLKRGLTSIRNVVHATLWTYKSRDAFTPLTRGDVDDLQFLIQHEALTRGLRVDWSNELPDSLPVAGSTVRQIALNLLLNACQATPTEGKVQFSATINFDSLVLRINDEGPGLPPEAAALVDQKDVPKVPPASNVGLGLWTTVRLVQTLGGLMRHVPLQPGTSVTVEIPLSAQELLHETA